MRIFKGAATVVTAGAVLVACGSSHGPESQASPRSEIEQLAHDPAKLKNLGNTAVSNFEKAMKSGSAHIWVFADICAVIDEAFPYTPKGVEVAGIVPNPGILHVQDPKTGITFTEAIAWEASQNKYITGQEGLFDKHGDDIKLHQGHDQYNIPYSGDNVISVRVAFSAEQNAVVAEGTTVNLMDSVGVVIGPNVTSVANSSNVMTTCENSLNEAIQGAQPVVRT